MRNTGKPLLAELSRPRGLSGRLERLEGAAGSLGQFWRACGGTMTTEHCGTIGAACNLDVA
jgi:hypothetical protein